MHTPPRIGILGSGSGSNFQSILDAVRSGSLQAEIVLVLSDVKDAFILERAKKADIPTEWIDCQGYKSKFPQEAQEQTAAKLRDAGVDMVCLAGFMRLVGRPLLDAFPGRIINIHPSLLPAFPGLCAWGQAIEAKAKESGCTVHYVDEGMDTGCIIDQEKVPVYTDDTPETLHQRIQLKEHILYPKVLARLLDGKCVKS